MNSEALRTDPKVEKWFAFSDLKPSSEARYLSALKHFVEFTGKTLTELIQDAKAERTLEPDERKLFLYITGFRKKLRDTLAPLTVQMHLAAVKAFYESNYVELPKMKTNRRGNKALPLKENTKIPCKEDLQNVLKICDPLEKCLILTGVSSGLSATELCNLKLKDFRDGYNKVTGVTTLHIRRQKTTEWTIRHSYHPKPLMQS
jgi:integrase